MNRNNVVPSETFGLRRGRRTSTVVGGCPVTFQYASANRVLELRFPKPLERFRTLKVDLLDGILGTDGQPLKPWTLSFSLSGS